MKNNSLLNKIFEKIDNEEKFTTRSKRYQVIITVLLQNKEGRTLRQLQNRVYDLYPDIYPFSYKKIKQKKSENEHYKYRKNPLSKSYRNEKGRRTFKAYLKALTEFDLILVEETKSIKYSSGIKKYSLTEFGRVIAHLIEYIENPDNVEIQNKIYTNWESYFSKRSYSLDIFCTKYFKKCREAGLLGDFLAFYRNSLIGNFHNYLSLNEVYTDAIFIRTNDKHKNKTLLNTWIKSYNELDIYNRFLFSYHVKLHLTRKIETGIHNYAPYEQIKFHNRTSDYDDYIVIEVTCRSCRRIYYWPASIMPYIRSLA